MAFSVGHKSAVLAAATLVFLAAEGVVAAPRRHGVSIMDARPNFPFDPNTIATCTWWWDHDGEIPCAEMPAEWAITMENFLAWNSSITPQCGNFQVGRSYCVEAPGSAPPTTAPTTAPTTTSTGNGISTPTPTQAGMVSNCNKFYAVKSGDSCAAIAQANSISVAQFVQWNPAVGADCTGLWANAHACVRVIGFTPPPTTTTRATTTTTTTTRGNGISTPTPTQPGMISNCDRFHKVQSGDTYASIGASNTLTAKRISDWNTSVGSSCTGLWADHYACVNRIGFTRSLTTTCHTASDHKTWGGNKDAALSAVSRWCGNSGRGSGTYSAGTMRRSCTNAPNGTNKIEFTIRNNFGARASMSNARCSELMNLTINRCSRGSQGVQEGWTLTSRVVAGRCWYPSFQQAPVVV